MDRRQFVAGTAAAALAGSSAYAQDAYPSRPITLINPFPPGGAADVVGRPFAAVLEPLVKQAVVMETKAGAAGQVQERAKPDGMSSAKTSDRRPGIGAAQDGTNSRDNHIHEQMDLVRVSATVVRNITEALHQQLQRRGFFGCEGGRCRSFHENLVRTGSESNHNPILSRKTSTAA